MASAVIAPQEIAESNEEVPDWVLAKRGLSMLINNKARDAQDLFARYPDSLAMCAGYSFAAFMDALMTFEPDKLSLATEVLKGVERQCTAETGWLKSMRKAFGSSDNISLADTLETQIILADSQVCLAILTFLEQDIAGYFKGGWILRKAWKVYQSSYNDILQLHKEIVGEPDKQPSEAVVSTTTSTSPSSPDSSPTRSAGVRFDLPNGYTQKIPYSHSAILSNHTHDSSGASTPNSMKNNCSRSSIDTSTLTLLKKSFSVNSALSKHSKTDWRSLSLSYLSTFHLFSPDKMKDHPIDKATIERLMGAVSFGYGLLQLGISLLPPSLLRITNFLGFGGDRQNGISCLMYARNGVDMRAPLATLSLLWYHTIVRPFYAIDGSNVEMGANAAAQLLEESEAEYGESAHFLFFKGRVYRLKSDIPNALKSFQSAVDNAAQREIKILSMHEVGWCHLIQLDYCNAESTFIYLKSWSRWSRVFYCYVAGISCAACTNPRNYTTIKEIRCAHVTNRVNQLDEFLARRAQCCPTDDDELFKLPVSFWRLLVYEMLYLWNALPSCTPQNIEQIKLDCETITREPMCGLSKLIQGSCYCIQREYSMGIQKFRSCLEARKDLPPNAPDAHVSAFSQFELAALLIKSDETKAEGKVLLQHMAYYKGYDFEQRLNVRVHAMLKNL